MGDVKNLTALRRFAPEKMQKIGLFETPRLFCDLYCLEPGQTQKAHSHGDADKVYLVLDGRAQVQSELIATTLHPRKPSSRRPVQIMELATQGQGD